MRAYGRASQVTLLALKMILNACSQLEAKIKIIEAKVDPHGVSKTSQNYTRRLQVLERVSFSLRLRLPLPLALPAPPLSFLFPSIRLPPPSLPTSTPASLPRSQAASPCLPSGSGSLGAASPARPPYAPPPQVLTNLRHRPLLKSMRQWKEVVWGQNRLLEAELTDRELVTWRMDRLEETVAKQGDAISRIEGMLQACIRAGGGGGGGDGIFGGRPKQSFAEELSRIEGGHGGEDKDRRAERQFAENGTPSMQQRSLNITVPRMAIEGLQEVQSDVKAVQNALESTQRDLAQHTERMEHFVRLMSKKLDLEAHMSQPWPDTYPGENQVNLPFSGSFYSQPWMPSKEPSHVEEYSMREPSSSLQTGSTHRPFLPDRRAVVGDAKPRSGPFLPPSNSQTVPCSRARELTNPAISFSTRSKLNSDHSTRSPVQRGEGNGQAFGPRTDVPATQATDMVIASDVSVRIVNHANTTCRSWHQHQPEPGLNASGDEGAATVA